MINIDKPLYRLIANILLLVGGICWFFAGLFNVFLLNAMFGELIARLIYIIVGVAAGYLIYLMYLEKFQRPTV